MKGGNGIIYFYYILGITNLRTNISLSYLAYGVIIFKVIYRNAKLAKNALSANQKENSPRVRFYNLIISEENDNFLNISFICCPIR